MANASIIDIGGTQWSVKDREARERVTALEEKTSANFDYSLEEKIIGTWIDGKPLYRLVCKGSKTTENVSINLEEKNIKEITSIKGVFKTSTNVVYPFNTFSPYNAENLTKYYSVTVYRFTNKDLYVGFGDDSMYSYVEFTIQLEYTKNE